MKALIPTMAASLIVSLGGTAGAAQSPQDVTFVTKAAQGGMAEVKLAQLALSKSSTPAVVSFAKHMQHDHSQANDQLMSIAQSQGYTLPSGVGPKNAMLMSQLQAQHGAAFDAHYLHSQLPAHEEVLALFRQEAANGQDPHLVAFAKQTIPVIEHHIALDRRDIAALGSGGAMSMMTGH